MNLLSKDELDKHLESAVFVFAKSMPKIPHEYTLKEAWGDINMFEKVVQHIRDHGNTEMFFKKAFTYYYLNGYKYWTMGNPINETRLINRAKA